MATRWRPGLDLAGPGVCLHRQGQRQSL